MCSSPSAEGGPVPISLDGYTLESTSSNGWHQKDEMASTKGVKVLMFSTGEQSCNKVDV